MPLQVTSFVTRLLLTWSVSVACWALLLALPQIMQWEHGMQRIVAKIFYSQYQQGGETGTHGSPFTLSKIDPAAVDDAPFVVAMGEDPERIFDANPLSASDAAVLLDALKKSNVQAVVISSPFAWPEADPFALDALEYVMSRFTACVTSAVLSRAAQPEPMPAALVRASIPLSRVTGSAATLPVVNRVAVAGTYLGRQHTWAGFSAIESEVTSSDRPWLLARWGDRVIFSTALLAVLVRENIHPDELVIVTGQSIQAPRTGHHWVIDEFGRGLIRELSLPQPDLQAPQLIRPEPEVLASLQHHTPPVHLLRLNESPDQLQVLSALHQSPRLVDHVTWSRFPLLPEWGLVTLISLVAAAAALLPSKIRWLSASCIVLLWLVVLLGGKNWIPVAPGLLGWIVACRWGMPSRSKSAVSDNAADHVVTTALKEEQKTEDPLSGSEAESQKDQP